MHAHRLLGYPRENQCCRFRSLFPLRFRSTASGSGAGRELVLRHPREVNKERKFLFGGRALFVPPRSVPAKANIGDLPESDNWLEWSYSITNPGLHLRKENEEKTTCDMESLA